MRLMSANTKLTVQQFASDERGAQVVEYALIIALVSIALALLLADNSNGLGTAFSNLVARVNTCLTATTC